MISRNLYLHLRLPFSFFLLPVFLFALSDAVHIDWQNAVLVFIALHFFIYPASNLYNSFMDRDEGPIGSLEHPPPVHESFFLISIIIDVAGLFLLVLADIHLLIPGIIYSGISRIYSWRKIRLKKYPFTGWMTVAIFQGGFTYYLVHSACTETFGADWLNAKTLLAASLASLLIGACYPFTQIYQHEEDASRGDRTISLYLGIKGTFLFSAFVFAAAIIVAAFYFTSFYLLIFLISLLPVIVFYLYWLFKVWKDITYANYSMTMQMIILSSVCMSVCWLIILFMKLRLVD